jgi:hypothetical protein
MCEPTSFMELLLRGEVLAEQIDDFVDRWSDDPGVESDLHEYLGLTWDEYALWVEKPSALRYIAAARVQSVPLDSLRDRESHDMQQYRRPRALAAVARAAEREQAVGVLEWLRDTGRI